MKAVALGVMFALGCGGSRVPDPPPEVADTSPSPSPSPRPITRAWPDAGPPADPLPLTDAGLADIGSQPCEVTIGRLLRCPAVPEADKQVIAQQQADLRKAAQDPNQREEVARSCIEVARALEDYLLQLGC
ncbi:MAG TPA: hypothetical protein VMZ28_19590 [Kofleriaceae bacterium]|nr:hypothetical protein [Kofleriaceae bacterium]